MAIGLMATGYLLTATVAFWIVRERRKIAAVQFLDIALPWRWDNYRVARGDTQIAAARRFVEERKFREALMYARNGLAQSPANRDGRLLLAELLVTARRTEFARETLMEGLPFHAGDPLFLKPLLTFLLQQQEDMAVMEIVRKHFPGGRSESDVARLLALAGATASWFRGDYDRAEDFLRSVPKLSDAREGRLLAVKIERDRGYRELALMQMRQLSAELPGDPEIHRELVEQLRQQGRDDEARRSSLAFQIGHPTLAGPRIELLHAYRLAREPGRMHAEVEALIRDFPEDNGALLGLADFAASGGDIELVRRVERHAIERQLVTEPYKFLAVESAIVARDYQGALEAIRAFMVVEHDGERRYRSLFDSLQAIAHHGLGDGTSSRLFLTSFLTQPNLRAENLLAVANRFAALEGSEQAWQTLARATEVEPLNQAVLARLIELDLALNRVDELAIHVQRFVKMRRPSPDILRVAQQRMGSDVFLFSNEAPAALEAVRGALEKTGDGWRR